MSDSIITGQAGETHLLLGNEAIVRGALEAGISFVSCYPGTPSSEAPDTFFRLKPKGEYYFEYSVNEKVAMEVAAGAALAGARALVTMKHVGVNVAADPLLTLAQLNIPGALVLLSGDDPGCHSSQNEQDNRYFARLAGLPCFEPSTAQECKDMAREALRLSAKYGHCALLRTTTRINHLRGPVEFGPPEPCFKPAPFSRDAKRYVPLPAFARLHHVAALERLEKIKLEAENSPFNRTSGQGETGFIASGVSRAYLSDVLAEDGLTDKAKVLELGFSYPLPEKLILNFIQGLKRLVVLEELEPILETEIRALCQREGVSLDIQGKSLGLPRFGEYSTQSVREAVNCALGQDKACAVNLESAKMLAQRPPNLCAGCPHRSVFYTAREVFGDEAIYSSDIGCYTLGIMPPFKMADFLVCMGSSVSAGGGFAKASGQRVVSFIGDSTFFHSGVTGLINATFNHHDLILVILDNDTTAMTGHQPNPGVSTTVFGANPGRLDILALVAACGVTQVRKVKATNHAALKSAMEEFKTGAGVRVLITEEPCPIHARRSLGQKKTQSAEVSGDALKAKECMKSLACPAFYEADGGLGIDETACSGCMFCLQICKEIKVKKRGAAK